MGYIPPGVNWYTAKIVIEITAEGVEERRVWMNYHVLRASSPDEALAKAEQLGRQAESVGTNALGHKIRHSYRGLADLQVVLGELEDGAEVLWEEYTRLAQQDVEDLVLSKEELGAFDPDPTGNPDDDPRFLPWELRHQAKLVDGLEG
jgi:hypothetical protein